MWQELLIAMATVENNIIQFPIANFTRVFAATVMNQDYFERVAKDPTQHYYYKPQTSTMEK